MKDPKEIFYLKGKEAFITNLLMLVVLIVFSVPIVLIFLLRGIYKLIINLKNKYSGLYQETEIIEKALNKE